MNISTISSPLGTILHELVQGPPENFSFVLNPGDDGLLASLDRLSAEQASTVVNGAAPIAAHVEHLRYGMSLLARWAAGENPYADADWQQAWTLVAVDDNQWRDLRQGLREAIARVETIIATPRELVDVELNGIVATVVHLAYHIGAMRQIAPEMRGPRA